MAPTPREFLRLFGRHAPLALALLALILGAGCGPEPEESIARAYVAPASVNLRSQLNQKNATVAVLKHGERVSIVDVRRRFVKVRTAKGTEGWLDSLDLLSAEDMQRLQRDRIRYAALPSQGAATAYETLNIHLDPGRKSPAFTQIPEGASVTLLAHKLVPKVTATPRVTFLVERPKPAPHKPRKAQAKTSRKGPPMPPAPKPPPNWQELSAAQDHTENDSTASERGAKPAPKDADDKKPPILEDWTLVRTKANQTGWVLSHNLMVSIPDEVAQYAEGRHITSYFELGSVNDEEKGVKHDWLWTTRAAAQPFDFDSWRVFLWNRHRHRYETSYRQRDVEGYFPVHVEPADPALIGRTFQLITKDDDGKFHKRSYHFDGSRVHLTGTEDYRPGEAAQSESTQGVNTKNIQNKMAEGSWWKHPWLALKERFSSH